MSCSNCLNCGKMVLRYEKYCGECVNDLGLTQDETWWRDIEDKPFDKTAELLTDGLKVKDGDCPHLNFKVDARVARLTEKGDASKVTGYHVEITCTCHDCFLPFVWKGVPGGFSPSHPTTDVERITLRAPIEPV